MTRPFKSYSFIIASILVSACASKPTNPSVQPSGGEKSTETSTLEKGSQALQTQAPANELNVYLVGFHPMKDDPSLQMEAHHFCKQVNADFAQCALFDGNTAQANLTGIEYIISKNLYDQLTENEKQFWHPHNYEILSGQLVAPGLPESAEHELMKEKINSYGKTWHVWNTGHHDAPGERLPLGEPMLAWSFNHDGEAHEALIRQRDQTMNISTSEKRADRQDLVELAGPQGGVNAIAGKFPGPLLSIPGVSDLETQSPERAPAGSEED